jgi:tight adherence protein C
MDLELLVIWGLALGSAGTIVFLLAQNGTDRFSKRLMALEHETSSPPSAEALKRMIPRLGNSQTVQTLEKHDPRLQLRERILQAGLYKPRAMNLFVTLRIVLCAIPFVAGLAAGSLGLIGRTEGLLFGAFAGLLGTVLPAMWLDHRKRQRQLQIRRSLPDALDVIVVCLEAGLSVSNSLARVARELSSVHPLLGLELCIVEREVQMGRTIAGAMREFAQRIDLEELRSLATVISQAEQFGTSVVKAFNVYATSLRVRRHQRAEEMAQKAGIKTLFPTLLCIFPGMFIVVMGPAVIRIYQTIVQMKGN